MRRSREPADDDRDNGYLIQSLIRGIEVLRLFGRDRSALSLAELVELTGLNRTTTYRFVSTLRHLGLVEVDAQTRRYRLGSKVLELGFHYLHGIPLVELAQPVLRALRNEVGESAHLAILDGSEVVYIARAAGERIISASVSVGSRLSAQQTSMGRALLAWLPADALERVLRDTDQRPTNTSNASPAALSAALQQVREDGFAVSFQDYEPGVCSVAAAVRTSAGPATAAVNVAGPVDRFTPEAIRNMYAPAVTRAADQLSALLGATVDPADRPRRRDTVRRPA
jgi:IclR family transcriptional regulator, pca regulon regulatory protein